MVYLFLGAALSLLKLKETFHGIGFLIYFSCYNNNYKSFISPITN